MKLYIKNMVCPRCMKAVEQIVTTAGAEPVHIQLGEVVLKNPLSSEQLIIISGQLKELGFELLDNTNFNY